MVARAGLLAAMSDGDQAMLNAEHGEGSPYGA